MSLESFESGRVEGSSLDLSQVSRVGVDDVCREKESLELEAYFNGKRYSVQVETNRELKTNRALTKSMT